MFTYQYRITVNCQQNTVIDRTPSIKFNIAAALVHVKGKLYVYFCSPYDINT